jgi:hypothetical protein
MYLYHLDLIVDAQRQHFERPKRLGPNGEYRLGEPSGMLVAIAGFARAIERAAARIDRWARRPARADYLPRVQAR